MLTHIWRVVWWIIRGWRHPHFWENGQANYFENVRMSCFEVYLRAFFRPTTTQNPKFSLLAPSALASHSLTYLSRARFEVPRPFYLHFEVFCLWITAKKSKFPSPASRAREVFRWPYLAGDVYKNKVFASTFVCRFVSWAWGVVVPQEWVWQLISDFTFNSQ